jgi:hypothetical protein
MLTRLPHWLQSAISIACLVVVIACILVVLGCGREKAPSTNSATSNHSQEIPLEVQMDAAKATEQYQRTRPR